MGKTSVLDRVAADLARGLTHPAIQRLSSLVAAHPTDLDLRRRLAAVHRRVGNRIQAGRWDYLTIGADSSDTSAFERAFPSAVERLREMRWPYRASTAATSYARARLAKLAAAAEAERPAARRPEAGRSPVGGSAALSALLPSRLPGLRSRSPASTTLFAVAAAATATLVVVGVATVIEWIVQ
jgi:hypothetical protein